MDRSGSTFEYEMQAGFGNRALLIELKNRCSALRFLPSKLAWTRFSSAAKYFFS